MRKLFIWDFHGTLEKGNENAVLDYMNMALEREGYERRLSAEECREYYGIKIWEFFQRLLPSESPERCMELQGIFLEMEKNYPDVLLRNIKPNDGALEVLQAIHESSHDQVLISNTEISMLMPFITSIGIEHIFPEGRRFATNSHSGTQTKKHDLLVAFLYENDFQQFIGIGDSPGDLEFLDGYDATTYLYAHPGWNFRDYPATYMIRDLREVLKEI